MNKKFMTGTYQDLHFIAQWNGEIYKCIPAYSGGNGTNMTFFQSNPKAKFYDTLEDAIGNKMQHRRREAAIEEERRLTGYYNPEY